MQNTGNASYTTVSGWLLEARKTAARRQLGAIKSFDDETRAKMGYAYSISSRLNTAIITSYTVIIPNEQAGAVMPFFY
ncbi:hypothetical protein CCP4SC76_8130002 [Gammaproteobacteria bacterium]